MLYFGFTFPSVRPDSAQSVAVSWQDRAPTGRFLPTPLLSVPALCPTSAREVKRKKSNVSFGNQIQFTEIISWQFNPNRIGRLLSGSMTQHSQGHRATNRWRYSQLHNQRCNTAGLWTQKEEPCIRSFVGFAAPIDFKFFKVHKLYPSTLVFSWNLGAI